MGGETAAASRSNANLRKREHRRVTAEKASKMENPAQPPVDVIVNQGKLLESLRDELE